MPFHVEIGGSMQHARVFNLSEEDLMGEVVGPWLEDRTIAMGDREWRPSESSLRILEGPQMDSAGPGLRSGMVERPARLRRGHPRICSKARRRLTRHGRSCSTRMTPKPESRTCLRTGPGGRFPGARRGRHWTAATRRSRLSSSSGGSRLAPTRKVDRDASRHDQDREGGRLEGVVAGCAEDDLAGGRLGA